MENALRGQLAKDIAMQQLAPFTSLAIPSFCACCSPEVDDVNTPVEFLESVDKVGEDWLRLCVHHGKHFPNEATFVEVFVDKGRPGQKQYSSAVCTPSSCPVWDFIVEFQGSFVAGTPTVEINIKRDSWNARTLGTTQLNFPRVNRVQRQEYLLETSEVRAPSIVVAWQLGEGVSSMKHDLSRAGNLGEAAMHIHRFCLVSEIRSLSLANKAGWSGLCVFISFSFCRVVIFSKGLA